MEQSLQIFVEVAEKKNFSRAAEALHMTQPSVSQHIHSLENSMGTKLLERTNKFVRLTKAGEITYHHAKEILGLHTKMKSLVDELMETASGSISIGASFTYGEYILPHIISRLLNSHPLVNPSIKIANTHVIAEEVLNHQLDVGIVEGAYRNKQLIIEDFAEDSMYMVVASGHPLAVTDNGEITVDKLQKETWIVREEGSGTREATDKLFSVLGINSPLLMEFGSTQIIKESVEAGLGITLLSESTIRKELKLGTLKILSVPHTPFKRTFSIVSPNSPYQSKALEVFLGLVKGREQM